LEGSKEIIERDRPTILIELLNHQTENSLNNYLKKLGYKTLKQDKDSVNILYHQ